MNIKTGKASLSFGAILNDLVDKTDLKQQLNIPACSEDVRVFVDIMISGTTTMGTIEDPLRISVNPIW